MAKRGGRDANIEVEGFADVFGSIGGIKGTGTFVGVSVRQKSYDETKSSGRMSSLELEGLVNERAGVSGDAERLVLQDY